jgi:hypothetical protein
MKKVASLILSCALVFFVPALALAQMEELKNSTPEERAAVQTQWMQNNLSLDAQATNAVSAINLEYAKETQKLQDSDSSKLDKLMTFKRNSQAKAAELKAILTPEQYALYQQKRSEMEDAVRKKLKEKYQSAQ